MKANVSQPCFPRILKPPKVSSPFRSRDDIFLPPRIRFHVTKCCGEVWKRLIKNNAASVGGRCWDKTIIGDTRKYWRTNKIKYGCGIWFLY